MKRILLGCALFAACGGGGAAMRPGGGREDVPEWVAQGSGAHNVEGIRRLYGVGGANAPDPKARRRAADTAARQQLYRSVDALAQAMAKMSNASADADALTAIARRAAQASSAIRDHWVTAEGAEQALDVMDLDAFKNALQTVEGDDKLKSEMANDVERAFDQIARQ